VLTAATPASRPSAGDVLARMTALNASLHSYTARVHFYIKLHSFITLPIRLSATYYFKRPDKALIVFDSVPKSAQTFKHFYATRGTSESWPKLYGVAVLGGAPAGTYLLGLTPKTESSLGHAVIAVDRHTYAEVHEDWFYRDGSTIKVDTQNGKVGGYLLPVRQEGDFDFPSYKAHVVADFESYTPNVDIPDSVFK
jgi:hypothetical protein